MVVTSVPVTNHRTFYFLTRYDKLSLLLSAQRTLRPLLRMVRSNSATLIHKFFRIDQIDNIGT